MSGRRSVADSLYYRERAAQALRIVQDNSEPEVVRSLIAFAAEYVAKADAIEAKALVKDPSDH
jgi:hypothetical protein